MDWDFEDAWTRYGLNLLHWYPTKLAPQIASKLIVGLSERGDIICDPFCGSGTVLSESMRLGRRSIGIDISPIACMISKAKTTLIPGDQLIERYDKFLNRAKFGLEILNKLSSLQLFTTLEEKQALTIIESYKEISFKEDFNEWFETDVLRDIAFTTACLDYEPNDYIKLLITVAISSMLRTCCSQNRSWGYIADNVKPKKMVKKDVCKILQRRLREQVIGMQMASEQCVPLKVDNEEINRLTNVINGNSMEIREISSDSTDCVITSPPYLSVSDNIMSQRLSMQWLGYDAYALRDAEIGARWKRFRKDAFQTYINDMKQSLSEIARILKSKGRFALILGASSKREQQYPVLNMIDKFILNNLNMIKLGNYSRKLSSQRQHGSHGVLSENIYIYQKN